MGAETETTAALASEGGEDGEEEWAEGEEEDASRA